MLLYLTNLGGLPPELTILEVLAGFFKVPLLHLLLAIDFLGHTILIAPQSLLPLS